MPASTSLTRVSEAPTTDGPADPRAPVGRSGSERVHLSRWCRCCSGTRPFENHWLNVWFAAGGGRPREAGLTGCTVLLRWFYPIFGVTQTGISHLTSYFHNYFEKIYNYQLTH